MRALVLVMLLGCDRGVAGDCGPAASAVLAIAGANSKLAPQIEERCTYDHWTGEAKRCFAEAKSNDAREICEDRHLTQDQLDKLDKALAPAHASATRRALAMMDTFKGEMCKCKDAKCAQDVSDKMVKWSQDQAKRQRFPPKLSEDDQQKAAAIGEQMGKCMQMAMSPPPAHD